MKKYLTFLFLILVVNFSYATNGITYLPNMPVSNQSAATLEVDTNGIIYTGYLNGLMRYSNNTWTNYKTSNSNILSDKIVSLAVTSNNEILIGSDIGFSVFDGNTFTTYNNTTTGIPAIGIDCLLKSQSGYWLGTKQGLFNYNAGILTTYNAANGSLNNDTILNIKELNGTIWTATKNGLTKITNNIANTFLSTNSNLHSNNLSDIAIYDNKLWIVYLQDNAHFINVQYFDGNNFYQLTDQNFQTKIDDYQYYQKVGNTPEGLIFQCLELSNTSPSFLNLFTNFCYYNFLNKEIKVVSLHQSKINYRWYSQSNSLVCNFINTNISGYFIDFNQYSSFGGLGLLKNNKYVDINNVRALMMNRGDMHWNQGRGTSACEFPKGSGKNIDFAQALWLSGIDNGGSLHTAAQTYRQTGNDFWPGPLDTITGSVDTSIAIQYDKIWKINRSEIEEFKWAFQNGLVQNGTYLPIEDIIDWPALGNGNLSRKLAPFVDVNGDGLYNPMLHGDYPLIKGDQQLYWIFNDKLSGHGETSGLPFGVEIHASAYAYQCNSLPDSLQVVNNTVFYNFDIINRSSYTYHDFNVGNWRDPDLGLYTDDYIASRPDLNLTYTLNSDAQDGTGYGNSYGYNPPLSGNTILNGGISLPNDSIDNDNNGIIDEANEKNLMAYSMVYENDPSVQGNPSFPTHFYNYMRSKWKDNSPLTIGATGYGGAITTKFAFDGDPWDTLTWNCQEIADWRTVQSSGPNIFAPDDTIHFAYAMVNTWDTTIAWGTQAYYENFYHDVATIRRLYSKDSIPSCLIMNVGTNNHKNEIDKITMFPNPANHQLNFKSTNQPITQIIIYDLEGRQLESITPNNFNATVGIHYLADGVYLIKVYNKNEVQNFKAIKIND